MDRKGGQAFPVFSISIGLFLDIYLVWAYNKKKNADEFRLGGLSYADHLPKLRRAGGRKCEVLP